MRLGRYSEPVCLKFHAVSRWVASHLGRTDHERRVAGIAATLFDLTGPLHGLESSDLRLLKLAAMVHDVGRAIDDDNHPQIGARMIRDAAGLPLSGTERRCLAYLTYYHKGRVPSAGCDGILRAKDDARRLLLLLALLRVADAMDSRSAETPRLRFALEGRRLRITCRLELDTPKARKVYTRRKKFRLLEELLDCRVEVSLCGSKAMQLVA